MAADPSEFQLGLALAWLQRLGDGDAHRGADLASLAATAGRVEDPRHASAFGYLFEAYATWRLGLRHFQEASLAFLDSHPDYVVARSQTYADLGVDALSQDELTAVQIKWRSRDAAKRPGTISEREIGTFYAYADLLGLGRTLAANPGTRLALVPAGLVAANRMALAEVPLDRFAEFCGRAAGHTLAPPPPRIDQLAGVDPTDLADQPDAADGGGPAGGPAPAPASAPKPVPVEPLDPASMPGLAAQFRVVIQNRSAMPLRPAQAACLAAVRAQFARVGAGAVTAAAGAGAAAAAGAGAGAGAAAAGAGAGAEAAEPEEDEIDLTRAQIQMACGSGKSRVMAELLAAEEGPTALFVPSLALLEQNTAWLLAAPCPVGRQPIRVMLVGTRARCEQLAAVAAIAGAPGRVVVPGGEIRPEPRSCCVCVNNSAKRLADCRFAMIAVDEAHHVWRGPADQAAAEARRARIEAIPAERRLYVTATPQAEGLAFSYPIPAAIRDGIICDYQAMLVVTDPDQRPAAALVRLLDARRDLHRVLAYCNSCDAASEFAAMVEAAGMPAATFDYRTPPRERHSILARFEAGAIRVLATVHVLGEGVDLPAADTCMFVEPRGSSIDVVQCLGRCLRLHPEKRIATVVLPTSEEGDELDRFARQLGAADIRWRDTHWRMAHRCIEYAGAATAADEITAACDKYAIEIYQRDEIIFATEDLFGTRLAQLRQFITEHGKMPSQSEHFLGERQLAIWCVHRRQEYKRGTLSAERIAAIKQVPTWSWEFRARRLLGRNYAEGFALQFERLREYAGKNGHLPSQKDPDPEVRALGSFVNNRRGDYRRGALAADRIAAFEQQIPGWEWAEFTKRARVGVHQEENFQLQLGKVAAFRAANGHLPRQEGNDEEERQLGQWCMSRKTEYKAGVLSPERAAACLRIPGWKWKQQNCRQRDADPDVDFAQMLERVKAYVAAEDKLPSQSSPDAEIKQLGQWCMSRRRDKKAGRLSDARKAACMTVPHWTW